MFLTVSEIHDTCAGQIVRLFSQTLINFKFLQEKDEKLQRVVFSIQWFDVFPLAQLPRPE